MTEGRKFGTDVRVLVCKQCGAPLMASLTGGNVTCEYCGVVSVIAKRKETGIRITDPTLQNVSDPEERERLRMESLWKQMEDYDEEKNPYAYYGAPEDLEHVDLDYFDTALPSLASEEFRKAVKEYEESDGDMKDQRHVFWLALKLKNMWVMRNKPHKARPTIETASEILDDPGYRQLMLCKLADLARKANDLDAAGEWLSQCDPKPPLLDLDSDYRTTASSIAVRRQEWNTVLDLVGQSQGDVPFEPSSVALFQLLRVVALENLGEHEAAESEFDWLRERLEHDFLEKWLEGSRLLASCQIVWDRIKKKSERSGRGSMPTSSMEHREANEADSPDSMQVPAIDRSRRRILFWTVIVILALLCVSGFIYISVW